jgi:hypothetical protein
VNFDSRGAGGRWSKESAANLLRRVLMLRKLSGAGAVMGLLFWTASASAQFQGNSGGTSSGLFGSRSVGQSGSIQSSPSNLFGGTGGTSNATVRGAGGAGASQLFQTQSQSMDQRSINAGRNMAQSFVGADAGEVRGVGTVGGGTGGNLLGGRGFQNQFNQNQFRQFDQLRQQFQNFNNQGQNRRTQVRVSLSLGFTPTAPVGTAATVVMAERRLPRLPGVTLVGTPQVLMEGRTAVVRGVAASERDRELVSRLLLLEPGISSVRNEMTVAQASLGPGSIPTPPSPAIPEPPPAPPQS